MDMVAAIFTPSTPTSASTSTSTSKSTMASPELGMGMGSPSNQHHPIIHKLKKTLFDLASTNANFNPNDPSQFAALQTAFLHTFSSSTTTPTHPPYAAMIQESIEKLDEEGILTTEGMISKHIVNNYEGLPWAHKTYLKHHLDKLCESNDYICYADGTYNVPGKIKPKRKLTKRKITTKEDVVVGEENLAHEQVIELSDNHLLIQEDAGKGKRKRRRSFVFDEEEEEEGDKSLEMRVVVGEVNRDEDNGKEIGEVETVNEVLPLEGVEVEECKNTVLEQLHPRTSEEDHELVDVETEDEALLVKGVEAEECKSKELEELNPSPSEKDHGMVDVDFVKGVEVDGCNSKELEQLHPRTSEEDHGLVEVESINEVSLMKGVEVEECKGKELQLHPSPSEEDHGMVEVQTVNEVVLLEDVEVEGCKSNGLEQLHLSTSEEDHEMVDVDAINEVLLVKGVEVEECKSKELEQLHPRTSEEDHGMMNVETVSEVLLVKSVEVEEFKSKELEQLHLRTSEGGHGMMDVVTVNEVLLVKGIGVEESKSKGLEQFHTSSSEVIHGMVDVETVDEVLLVKGVEVEECKSKGLGELHPRISEEDHGRVEMETVKKVLLLKGVEVEKCKSKGLEQLRPSTYEEGRDMVDVGEGNKDPELGMVSSKEVENQVLEMDPDFSEVMSLEDNHGGNLAVDILYPLVVVPLATVPNFKSDVIGSTIENPVLEETEPHSSPSRLMMAPYEDNPVKCASVKQVIPSSKSERPLIVCALKYVKDEEEKRKNRVSHSKKAKFSQKKTEGLKEKPMPASCWQRDTKTKVKQRGQFPKSKGTILFEDGSVKHFEDQMSSHPNGLENISMEDEEPLSHVYEKCGARKKHGMQIAKSGAHSPKVLPNSESFGKETTTIEKEPALTKKVENHLHMQLRSQDMNRHNVEDYTMKKSSSSFLEESGTKDSERTTNQLPAITKSNRVDSSSEPFEHPMEDNEEQNQHEGVQHPQQKNKDDKERPLELTEPTPEDEAYSSDQLLKPTSHQHSLQQNEQLKNSQQIKRGRGRPRNPNISPMKDATVPLLNLATTTPQCSDKQSKEVLKEKIAMENVSDPSSSQQKNESPKQEVRLRTRKQTATKKDAVVLSEPHLNEQEGLSNQNNQLGKAGRGRPEESKLTPQEATRSRGRPRKLSKLTGEHLVLPLNLDCEQKVELCELGNHQQSQHQNKKLTRGRDKIQKLGDNVGETLCSLCQNEQNGGCGRASDQHSGSQPRNNSRTQSSVEGETNSTQRKEFVAASHVALEALSARSQVDLKDQIIARRRSPRCFEAKKTLIDSQNHKSHDVQLHDQRKIGRLTPALVPLVSPDKVSVNLKDEVYSKPAGTEQANLPLDGKTHTPVSNNSKDPEHQEESRDHEACEKMEVQLTLPKQMTAKSVPKQVPLSSMRQLRSRVNRQSQVLEGTHTLHNLD